MVWIWNELSPFSMMCIVLGYQNKVDEVHSRIHCRNKIAFEVTAKVVKCMID